MSSTTPQSFAELGLRPEILRAVAEAGYTTPTPIQLQRALPRAHALFPLGEAIDAKPWMGARPCLPDMLPVIGKAPRHAGLWFDFGHQHHGLTLGPATGRLLAEMMTGETPFADPRPFAVERFG